MKTLRRLYSTIRDPLSQYDYLVSQHRIKSDQYQRGILQSLQTLHQNLANYHPPQQPASSSSSSSGWLSSLFKKKTSENEVGPQPQGVYLYGDVGCGKTMLMDTFFSTIPSHLSKKRIHFHAFMQDIHKRQHRLKSQYGSKYDAAPHIASEISKEAQVLCFDEFQVTDVADAMILRRLIDILYSPQHGIVIFYTSNRAPDALYENGVQRSSFIPCIEKLKKQNQIIYLKSPTDYRKIDRPSQGTYFYPPKGSTLDDVRAQAIKHADSWFYHFGNNGPVDYDTKLEIWGRPITIPKSIGKQVAQFSFDELCGKPLSAADYLELTRNFPCFVLTDIPTLSVRQHDVTRRFITFLDAAYESKARIAVTVEKPFEHLFNDAVPGLKQSESVTDVDPDDSTDILSTGQFAGAEEMFAFSRALSRLKQMSSKDWHDQASSVLE